MRSSSDSIRRLCLTAFQMPALRWKSGCRFNAPVRSRFKRRSTVIVRVITATRSGSKGSWMSSVERSSLSTPDPVPSSISSSCGGAETLPIVGGSGMETPGTLSVGGSNVKRRRPATQIPIRPRTVSVVRRRPIESTAESGQPALNERVGRGARCKVRT